MSTKSEIESAITSVLTGNIGVTDWDEHEGILKTEPTSILEAVYAESYTEDSTGTHTVTTPNANFTYIATINKVGRNIVLTGSIYCVTTVASGTKILEIDAAVTDYLGSGLSYSVATNSNTSTTIEIRMNGNELQTANNIFSGERFRFSITYRALN